MSIYKNKKIIVLFLAPVTIGLLVFVYYRDCEKKSVNKILL